MNSYREGGQLHQVHSREATGEFAWKAEDSTGAGVVRLRRRHQENVGAFPHRFQAKRIPDLSGMRGRFYGDHRGTKAAVRFYEAKVNELQIASKDAVDIVVPPDTQSPYPM
jgi:hypothetical protein